MMNTANEYLQQTKEQFNTFKNQCQEYHEIIQAVINKFGEELEDSRKLELRYYPDSYNGRKVCFGLLVGEESNDDLTKMVLALISSNKIDDFLYYLTTVALPLFHNHAHVDDFHF